MRALIERIHATSVLCANHGPGPGLCRDCLRNLVYDATLVGAYLAVHAHVCSLERDLFRAELDTPIPCAHVADARRGYRAALTELRGSLARLADGLADLKDSGPSLGPCAVDA